MPSFAAHSQADIDQILIDVQQIIGYQFVNPANLPYLWLALQSASYTQAWRNQTFLPKNLHHPEKEKSLNQALALLGDKEHHSLVFTSTFRADTTAKVMHDYWERLGSNRYFVAVGRRSGLEQYIQVNGKKPQVHVSNSKNPDKAAEQEDKWIADAVEAIMGALYLDGGRAAIIRMMVTLDMFEGMPLGSQIETSLEYRNRQLVEDGFVLVEMDDYEE